MSVNIARKRKLNDEGEIITNEDVANLTDSSENSESESEEEDDNAVLVTDTIDNGINKVLQALKSDADVLKDKNVTFFPEIGAEDAVQQVSEKPVYLKDVQRERLLAGDADSDAEEDRMQDDTPVETFNQEQKRLRDDVVREFQNMEDEESEGEDGEDGLLVKRKTPTEIPEVKLPDPEKDADAFLETYLSTKSWIPKKADLPTYKDIVHEDDEEDNFEDKNEQFEQAYNFRYEDPNAATIVSYARDQTATRRDKLSSRQKKREKAREAREREEEKQKLEIAREKRTKVQEVSDKLQKIQEALGDDDADIQIAQLLANEDLDGDFDNEEWDKRMQKLFDEEFYGREGKGDKVDANLGTQPELEPITQDAEDVGEDVGEETVPRKLTRKEAKQKAEQFVNANEDLLISAANLKSTKNTGFRYREVDPESFGLTSRDILLASDKELNQFAGLKKLASYREKDELARISRKYGKRKHVRQWRKEVFGSEEAPDDTLWEKAKLEYAKENTVEPKRKNKSKDSKKAKKRKHN